MDKIPRIGLVSLGCAKNLVDMERLTSVLVAKGYIIAPDYIGSDLVLVNTCGFINTAIEESMDAIGEALNTDAKVIVMGCLGKKAEMIKQRFPKVCAVFGPGQRAAVLRGIIKAVGQPPRSARQQVSSSGILLTPKHYAYLKIADGCRHACSFCIIPQLRGPLRSRLTADIMREAYDLKERGVRELLIIAQDSSDYGFDLKDGSSLSSLCKELSALKLWLRVHYLYPSKEANRLVELMAQGLVLPYIDVPLQHANPEVLKRMRRPGNLERTMRTIERWRSICPDLAIRSTFITGFPGESRAEFEDLLDFIKTAKLDRVGCFPYSDVEGAAANAIPGAVDPEERAARAEELMTLQAQISKEKLKARVGRTYEVLIDEINADGSAAGRSKYEAPEVDGVILFADGMGLEPGDIVKAKIIDSDEYDLKAELAAAAPGAIAFNPR